MLSFLISTVLAYNSLTKVSHCHYYYSCPSIVWSDINVDTPRGQDKRYERAYQCDTAGICPIYNEKISPNKVDKEIISEDDVDKYNSIGDCRWFYIPEFFRCLEVKRRWYTEIYDQTRRYYNFFGVDKIYSSLFGGSNLPSKWPTDNIYITSFEPEGSALIGKDQDKNIKIISLLGIKKMTDPESFQKYFDKKIINRWAKVMRIPITYTKYTNKDYKVQVDENLIFMKDGTLIQKIILQNKWGTPYKLGEASYDYLRDFACLYDKNQCTE